VRLRPRARIRSESDIALDRSVPELARAEKLIRKGRLLDAIDVLTDANHVRRDVDVERRLVELRFAAREELERAAEAPREWPPEVADLFPDTTGLPEIDASQLTSETLRSGILRHGCVLVRGFLDRGQADALVAATDRAFAAHDAWAEGTPASETRPWFDPLDGYRTEDRHWAREGGGVLAVESPRTFFDLVDAFESAGVRDLVGGYFGERPVLLANKWTLRRVRADLGDADWHQDGSFMGTDIRSLDLWIALSDCGRDAPGLDVVARRFDSIVATGTDGAQLDWTVGPGMVERVAEGKVVRPVFSAGDAMFFDHMFLHRTGIHPEMTRDRYAIEAWFASPSSYPAEHLPIAY
jgi:hypothetical protein